MYSETKPYIQTWGQEGVIWQICDWDPDNSTQWYDGVSYPGGAVNYTLEITLNTDVIIEGPIYIPDNQTLIIHTNGHSITPLRTTQAKWNESTTTGLQTITNNQQYYTEYYGLSQFLITASSGTTYLVKPSSTIWAYKYVPHCSFFVEGKLYILKSATIIQYTIKGRFMSR